MKNKHKTLKAFALTMVLGILSGCLCHATEYTNTVAIPGGTETTVTTNPPSGPSGWSQTATTIFNDVKGATNYGIFPYATYAPSAPKKLGGGILGIYDVNKYVGAGIGIDWLGQFSMVSGNVELKLPLAPLAAWGYTNFVATPFALAGVGTEFSGTGGSGSGSISTIQDIGGNLQVGHLWSGRFDVGASWGQWTGSSPYDGKRYHLFLGWSKGF